MRQWSETVILALGLILTPPDPKANNTPTSSRHPVILIPGYYPMPFDSELDAVISASNHHNPVSIREDREFIGGIFKDLNKPLFYYSAFAGKRGEDKITATLSYPKYLQLIAIWHTHGAGKGLRLYFSQQDIKLAERLKMPVYLTDSSEFLKKYSPGDPILTKYRSTANNIYLRHAKGEYIRNSGGGKLKVMEARF